MHIKPYIPLGLATLCAGAGLGIIIATADPYTAEPVMRALFWGSLFLTIWGLVATVLMALRQAGLGIGCIWAVAVTGLVMASRQGHRSVRLSGSVMIVTLLVSLYLWRRSKLAE